MYTYNCKEEKKRAKAQIKKRKASGTDEKAKIMKVMVNGEARELTAMGINGIEWTNDLLGNYDALHYDNDTDEYTMTEDEFEWWEPVVKMLNEINELEQDLDEDAKAEYEAECWPSDLDDEAKARLEWLRNRAK